MIVLTGGIGTGKSVVARILRLKGFGVFDCDFEARKLMESDIRLKAEIKELAGESIYVSGMLDRKLLSSMIFSNPDLRKKINSVVHCAVKDRIKEWLEMSEINMFVETAIAATSGIADEASEFWTVVASLETRFERVKSRDKRSYSEIVKIIEAQKREEELIAGTGKKMIWIYNNPFDNILEQLEQIGI